MQTTIRSTCSTSPICLKMLAALTHDDRYIESLKGEGGKPEDMCQVLDRVEARGKQEGMMETLVSLVKKGLLSVADAAKESGISPAEFQSRMAVPSAKK